MSKVSNTKLFIALLVIAAVVAGVKFYNSKKGDGNFKTKLADLDSAKISTILVYPPAKKGEEIQLTKEGNDWKIKITDTKSQVVDSAKMSFIVKLLLDIKPKRLAARGADKWQEFQVDTSGTHVIVKEGDKTTLDIVIGRYNPIGQREVETFVRLTSENETYAVNGFLGGFSSGKEAYRDARIVKGDKDSFTKLSFALGDTVSYTIEKRDSVWLIDGTTPANTSALDNYLNSLSSLNASTFIDDVDALGLGAPAALLGIDDAQGNKIKVEGFIQNNRKIIRSSQNTDNLLNGEEVWEGVFANKSMFLPVDTVAAKKK